MSLLLNLNLKKNKKLIFLLKEIYGLGLLRCKKICVSLGYTYNTKINELKEKDLNKLTSIITLKYKYIIDVELKKRIYDTIKHMKTIKSYRGIRHTYNRPVNGQRTRTNAKTQRRWK